MTENTMSQEAVQKSTKSKLVGVIRRVLLGAMIALLLFTIIMAVYRKFAG